MTQTRVDVISSAVVQPVLLFAVSVDYLLRRTPPLRLLQWAELLSLQLVVAFRRNF